MKDGARTVRDAILADMREGRGFRSTADRVRGEKAQRLADAARALPYHNAFLDDCLRAILPHDLIILGAETGIGKTEFAQSIGMATARSGKICNYFALEAQPLELEQRSKFKLLYEYALKSQRDVSDLNFADWMCGRCEGIVGDMDDEVEYEMDRQVANFRTYYRGEREKFGADDIVRYVNECHDETDLIVLDHLHYVDVPDENENRGFMKVMNVLGELTVTLGKPMIVVVHLKKIDERMKRLVPSLGDVHGTSNISKISTRAIILGRAYGQPYHPWLSPTYIAVQKDRLSGAPRAVALCDYDMRLRTYADRYTLGRAKHGTDVFVPLDLADVPRWAKRHRPLIGDPSRAPALPDDEPPMPPDPQQELYS